MMLIRGSGCCEAAEKLCDHLRSLPADTEVAECTYEDCDGVPLVVLVTRGLEVPVERWTWFEAVPDGHQMTVWYEKE